MSRRPTSALAWRLTVEWRAEQRFAVFFRHACRAQPEGKRVPQIVLRRRRLATFRRQALVARFPNRPPLVIDRIAAEPANNAGIVRDMRLVKMEEEDWDVVIATNLKSQFLCCRAVVPRMIEQQYGRIVNISSRAWLGGFGQANYSAAKGGVVSLTRSLAIESARDNITANAVAPGIVDTPLFRGFAPEVQQKLKRSVPVQRIGTPDDIAHAVLFFADPRSSYITGQTLYVCGGRSLSSPSV